MTGDTTGSWIEQWLSVERFSTYLRLAGGDRARALALHEWNTRVNAALLHDFAHLEVGLRNLYDRALVDAVVSGDTHWTDTASVLHLFPGAPRTRVDIDTARRRAGGPLAPPGKIMAELTFGFWVLLSSSANAPLVWQPHLQQVFPPRTDRRKVHRGLDDLRKLRNRVAHHEPIDKADVTSFPRRVQRYSRYISRDLSDYLAAHSTVVSEFQRRP